MERRFNDAMTLVEARALLRELVAEGYTCPCCTQFAKIYRRKINSTMARTLIKISVAARHQEGVFVHTPSLPGDTHEASQLAWWGLIEEEAARRPDGGRVGWWCLTPRGRRFVGLYLSVPKYARIYDGRCLGLEGDPVTIRDALGDRFDYAELMAA